MNSQESGTKVTKRSVGEKFDKLYKDFQKRERKESRASGVDVDRMRRDIPGLDRYQRPYCCELGGTGKRTRNRRRDEVKGNREVESNKTMKPFRLSRKLNTQKEEKLPQRNGTLGAKH